MRGAVYKFDCSDWRDAVVDLRKNAIMQSSTPEEATWVSFTSVV